MQTINLDKDPPIKYYIYEDEYNYYVVPVTVPVANSEDARDYSVITIEKDSCHLARFIVNVPSS